MRFTVTFLAGLLMLVLIAAVAAVAVYDRKSHSNLEANAQSQATLSAIRRIKVSTHALLSAREEVAPLVQEWEKSRSVFAREVQMLDEFAQLVGTGEAQINRLKDSWKRLDRVHDLLVVKLQQLQAEGVGQKVGTQGLSLAYERLLHSQSGEGAAISTLGATILMLEDYDRLVGEIEAELNLMAEWFRQESTRRMKVTQRAGLVVLAAALIAAVILLVRITRMHRSVVQDNRARQQAEAAVRASEESLRITLDSIGDGVIATDTHGRVVRMNPLAERLTGWRQVEAVEQDTDVVFRISDSNFSTEREVSPVTLAITTGKATEPTGHRLLLQRDGAVRPVQVMAAPMRDLSGAVVGAVLVFRDVTDQHRLEEQVRLAQKMESVGKLAGGLAHDFNNILQVIKANASFAREDLAMVGEIPACLNAIDQASNKAAELTRQLLAFGRQQTLKIEEVEPFALAQNIVKLIRRIIGEQIEVQLVPEADLDLVRVDSTQIEQVLINLCINARDAMPDGGKLTFELRNTALRADQLAGLAWAKPGRFVEILVQDTGCGMDKETLARIFEPFFTTKPSGVGTGLGLAVVQGIMQQHGGVIQVQSAPGCGTTFHLFLPSLKIADAKAGAAVRKIATADPNVLQARPGEMVLLAEDDPQVRLVAETILERAGFKVVSCADGEAACRAALEHLPDLSLLLFDVVMPHLGGPEAARRILQMRPDLPVVLCTGYAGGTTGNKNPVEEGWRVVNKPYKPEALIKTIRVSIDKRRNVAGVLAKV